jgi:hypothetical protein
MRTQIALLDRLRALLTTARPGTLRDFVPASTLHGADQDARDGIDADELLFRVLGVKQADPGAQNASSLWSQFEATLKKFDNLDALDTAGLRNLLFEASLFGLPEAVPQLPVDAASLLKALLEQAKRVKVVMSTRHESALTKWTPPAPPAKDVLQVCRDVTTTLLGTAFPLMPQVTPPGDLPPLPSGEVVEDWLFRVSVARENTGRLQHARVVAEELSDGFSALKVFQWPKKQTNWIGLKTPAGVELAGDLVSIVVQPAGSFDPTKPTGALVVDEWHELIANDDEITGISFHYDAPNTEPPQTLLLAVSQRLENNNLRWTWEEVVGCVDQALLLAKMRAVTPDELRHTSLDAVLPATLAAETTVPATISLSWFGNVAKEVALGMDNLVRKT